MCSDASVPASVDAADMTVCAVQSQRPPAHRPCPFFFPSSPRVCRAAMAMAFGRSTRATHRVGLVAGVASVAGAVSHCRGTKLRLTRSRQGRKGKLVHSAVHSWLRGDDHAPEAGNMHGTDGTLRRERKTVSGRLSSRVACSFSGVHACATIRRRVGAVAVAGGHVRQGRWLPPLKAARARWQMRLRCARQHLGGLA